MAGSLSWKRLPARSRASRLAVLGPFVPALALAALILAVLIAVILAEHLADARRRAAGEPSAPERSAEPSG